MLCLTQLYFFLLCNVLNTGIFLSILSFNLYSFKVNCLYIQIQNFLMSTVIFQSSCCEEIHTYYFQWREITSLRFCHHTSHDYNSWSIAFISERDYLFFLVLSIFIHSSVKQLLAFYTKSSCFHHLQSIQKKYSFLFTDQLEKCEKLVKHQMLENINTYRVSNLVDTML